MGRSGGGQRSPQRHGRLAGSQRTGSPALLPAATALERSAGPLSSSNNTNNNDGLAALGVSRQLEHLEFGSRSCSALGDKHAAAHQRRMMKLKEELQTKLSDHVNREQQRDVAAFSRSAAYSAGLLETQWRTFMVLAKFAQRCEEMRKMQRALQVIRSFALVRCVRFIRRQRKRRERVAKVSMLEKSMPPPHPDMLRDAKLTSRLPRWLQSDIAALAMPRGFLQDETIVVQDAPGSEVLVLLDGTVRATRSATVADAATGAAADASGGKSIAPRVGTKEPLAVVPNATTADLPLLCSGPGHILFESLFYCNDRYEVTLTAVTEVRLYVIPVAAFRKLVTTLTTLAATAASAPGTSGPADKSGAANSGDNDRFDAVGNASTSGGSANNAAALAAAAAAATAALKGVSAAEASAAVGIIERMMDQRRSALTEARCRLTEGFLRKASPVLQHWSADGVAAVIALTECRIHRKGDIMIPTGMFGKVVLFIVSGRIELYDTTDASRREIYRDGQCVGDVAALLHLKQPNVALRALSALDVWVLKASDLRHLACHENAYAVAPIVLEHAAELGLPLGDGLDAPGNTAGARGGRGLPASAIGNGHAGATGGASPGGERGRSPPGTAAGSPARAISQLRQPQSPSGASRRGNGSSNSLDPLGHTFPTTSPAKRGR
jgi:CRP-like cAMP-binding protein